MFSRLASLWRNLWHRDRVDRDLDAEVRAVFDILVDEKLKSGLSMEQARRAATLELGRVDGITQRVREERSGAWLDAIIKDVRYGARMLRANKGFTAVVVVSLAVGIGANSALFSIANALLLRTLPVPGVDHLYRVGIQSRMPVTPRYSYPFFARLRDGVPNRAALAAMSRIGGTRARVNGGEIERAAIQLVSGEYFGVLALTPTIGRLLSAEDDHVLSGHPVAVVSHAFWTRRMGASAAALGGTLELNGAAFTVIGVGPEGFTGVWLESPVDVWLPAMMQSDVRYTQNFSADGADSLKPWVPQDGLRWLELLTRVDRADGPEAAAMNTVYRAELLKVADAQKDPAVRKLMLDSSLRLESFAHGSSGLRAQFRAPLIALMAMVGLLLLIACANTANLLLARATNRQREMAVRLSIGASRARVITQLLVESLLLAGLAAVVGLAVAPLASEVLVRMTIGVETGPLPFSVGVDGQVLVFTAGIALLTGLLFGFAPAWRATDLAGVPTTRTLRRGVVSLADALKTGGRGNRSGARMNLSKMLVIAQVALSLLLAAGAGLFARSLGNLVAIPLGYQPQVLWVSINPSIGGYTIEQLPALYRAIIDRVTALPGVDSATIAQCGLMTGCRSAADGLTFTGYTAQPGEQVVVQENRVEAAYFQTVGMTIVAGRGFTPADSTNGLPIAVINEAAARRYFKDRDPVGQRFGYEKADIEIVGVIRDARVNTVREAPVPMAFYPLDKTPSYVGSMHVRTSGDPEAIAASLRKALQEAAPQLPVDRIVPIATLAAGTLRQERLIARLTTVLGLLALGLACLGIYGVMSYAVKQRTAELGIRFALGAPRPRVLWMVFRESLLLTMAGVAVGLPLLVAASTAIGGLLFNVTATDPFIVGGAMAVLLLVGATSSYLPSWRASRVDPLTALRQE